MTQVFAHRGYCGKYPENTMLAFEKAIELGVDGIENDIHFTRDGKIVIIHDEKIDRTCNGTGLVRDYALSDLRKFNVNCQAGDFYGFNPIPTIDEYFELVNKHDIVTNIEIKNGVYYYPGLEQAIIDKVRQYHLEDKIIFSSFNNPSVMLAKKLAPEIKCGFLLNHKIEPAGIYTKMGGVEFVHPEYKGVDEKFVNECNEQGVGINTWTVNDEPSMKKLIALGVNAIISNYPDYALKAREELTK